MSCLQTISEKYTFNRERLCATVLDECDFVEGVVGVVCEYMHIYCGDAITEDAHQIML